MDEVVGRVALVSSMLALLAGCANDPVPLSQLKGKLKLQASANATYVALTLEPDGATLPDGQSCLTLGAKAFANGVTIPQTDAGEERQSTWTVGDADDPCEPPSYNLSFGGSPPSALLTPVTKLELTDGTTSFEAELRNSFTTPAIVPDPSGALALAAGGTATLTLAPPAPGLAEDSPALCFYPTDQGTLDSYFCVGSAPSDRTLADDGVTFTVPNVPPATGTLMLSARAFEPGFLSCAGFADCTWSGMEPPAVPPALSVPATVTQ